MRAIVVQLIGLWTWWQAPRRDQRGLSQSTENAILLAGAVAVATAVIAAVTLYVTRNLPR